MNPTDQLRDDLSKRLTSRADGKPALRCGDAFDLARIHGIPLSDVGDLCNEQEIKIVQCQLGCFA
jgi:hypothetical protein